ncbi:hypothetical protein M9H77_26836 [Catharanthus roseus]|uniref:Uncharacterized protein n=1 Tax=Catharanthus roseus TaxID=4058 RepID=A0ACC0AF23_CATRO|nr:hypothetical protein M9H77_26836 [Catharanthus roseus]
MPSNKVHLENFDGKANEAIDYENSCISSSGEKSSEEQSNPTNRANDVASDNRATQESSSIAEICSRSGDISYISQRKPSHKLIRKVYHRIDRSRPTICGRSLFGIAICVTEPTGDGRSAYLARKKDIYGKSELAQEVQSKATAKSSKVAQVTQSRISAKGIKADSGVKFILRGIIIS